MVSLSQLTTCNMLMLSTLKVKQEVVSLCNAARGWMAHLHLGGPVSLWWVSSHQPKTEDHCDIQVTSLPSPSFLRNPFIDHPE